MSQGPPITSNSSSAKMKKTLLILSMVTLSGCATVQSWIPSFWDDNQSAAIVTVHQVIVNIDCQQSQLPQAATIVNGLQWFRLYSENKRALQQDVLRLIEPMEKTAKDWYNRNLQEPASQGYCESKKRIMIQQSERAARSILGRW